MKQFHQKVKAFSYFRVFVIFVVVFWICLECQHHSAHKLSCVWSNPISTQCLSRSRAGMVQRGWKFQSSLYHFPYHYSIRSHFSPSWVPRGSGATEKEGIAHSLPNFNMSRAKERGGVYTLLGVYYKAAITFFLFPRSSLQSLTLLTGSRRVAVMTRLNHLWQFWFDVTLWVALFVWAVKR